MSEQDKEGSMGAVRGIRKRLNWTCRALVTSGVLGLLPWMATPSHAEVLARVETGALAGAIEHGMRSFKGIPYAAPPVGALRWRPPQPLHAWNGVRDASGFGAACTQPLVPGLNDALVPGSEDCLSLNVYAPQTGSDLPVMVWIPGGGHITGGSAEEVFTPIGLVEKGVVVVTINYRLGRFGFFAPPAIVADAASRGEPVGNYGMMDMIAALQWVERNIAAFGGDPTRVTIFGESAGARSVTWLMTSPPARGLFQGAIAQSGRATEPLRGLLDARFGLPPVIESDGAFAAALGADTAEALRALPAAQLVGTPAELQAAGVNPFIDGAIIPGDAVPLFAAGKQAPVPFMLGINSWDASLFAGQTMEFDAAIAAYSEADRDEAKRLYQPERGSREAQNQLMQDERYGATLKLLAGSIKGMAPAFGYYFDYVTPSRRGEWPGAPHGWEMPFVFGSLPVMPAPDWVPPGDPRRLVWAADKNSPEDRQLSSEMSAAWAAFAKAGNPNVAGQPRWPVYEPDEDVLRLFASQPGLVTDLRKEPIAFQMRLIRERYGLNE
jgi:para-nitrobenzyl esterase